ncbi:MAG: hypothetical protein ACJA1L_001338 [Paracoccaceae bacterium]|jgi:hypothetical protein
MNRPNPSGLTSSVAINGKKIGMVISIIDTGSMNIPSTIEDAKISASTVTVDRSNEVAKFRACLRRLRACLRRVMPIA